MGVKMRIVFNDAGGGVSSVDADKIAGVRLRELMKRIEELADEVEARAGYVVGERALQGGVARALVWESLIDGLRPVVRDLQKRETELAMTAIELVR
jgi:hypothetical protein